MAATVADLPMTTSLPVLLLISFGYARSQRRQQVPSRVVSQGEEEEHGRAKDREDCDVARTVKRAFNLINALWHTHTQQRNSSLMRRGLA